MVYSHTQISQYIRCPRAYRYRYLDGWREKDTRAAMVFGRCFEKALASCFEQQDPTEVLFKEWGAFRDAPFDYRKGDSWDRLAHQGVHLLEKFAQDDRIRVFDPKENLQVKITRTLPGGNEFVSYIDAVGELDGQHCLIDWKTTTSRYTEAPDGLLSLDPQLICYSWMSGIPDVAFVVFVRKHLPEIQYLKATISEEQRRDFGRMVEATVGQLEAGQFPSHSGIRFPQNGCVSCSHLGLCLNNQQLIEAISSVGQEQAILIGLTNLRINGLPMASPKLNRRRALFVLDKIDEILAWEKAKEREKDVLFVDLGRYLCETRAGQYWRLENLTSFDEFLEKRFPESRRKAYYLMAIHENLTRIPKPRLREVGWSKAAEMVKVARRDGQTFDCATWLHKANELPKEEFKREVERHLTGKESEAWELIYFKLFKSQLPVIEQALETAAMMLGSDKSRGYMLEMICADFLAGANLDTGNSGALLISLDRLFDSLPRPKRQEFLEKARKAL